MLSPHLPEHSAGIGTFRMAAAVAEVSKGRSLHLSGWVAWPKPCLCNCRV